MKLKGKESMEDKKRQMPHLGCFSFIMLLTILARQPRNRGGGTLTTQIFLQVDSTVDRSIK